MNCGTVPAVKKKNPAAVALARLRAKALSPERRAEIAREGAAARTKALTAKERKDIARRAAAARWRK
jgi:hypothetical protein